MVKIKYPGGKLVRDRIPDIVAERKEIAEFKTVCCAEKKEYLKRKLIEEAYEVGAASSLRDVAEELADVLEVVEALAKANDFEMSDILARKEEKLERRGGFKAGVVLLTLTET